MDLIYAAEAQELVIELDAYSDLNMVGDTLPSWSEQGNPNYETLTDEQCEANEKENDRRAEVLDAALRAALREIAAERHLTIYVGDCSQATHTSLGPDSDETLERIVWQEAQDRSSGFIPEGQGW